MNIKKLALFSAALFLSCAISYAAEAEKSKTPAMPKAEAGAAMDAKGRPGHDFHNNHKMCRECMMKKDGMDKNGKRNCKECEKNAKKGDARDAKRPQKGFDRRSNNRNDEKRGFFPKFGKGFFGKDKREMFPNCKLSEDDIIDLVKGADSSFAKKLNAMKKDSKQNYRKAVNSLKMRLCFVKDKKSDKAKEVIKKAVASIKAETEVAELVSSYRKAAKENKPAIKTDLKTSIEKLFDMRIEEQSMRIQAMEEAIAEQKKAVEDKKLSKSMIVESRLNEMTGENSRW